MTGPAEKIAAYRAMGKSVPESDIDRLAEVVAARTADRTSAPAAPPPAHTSGGATQGGAEATLPDDDAEFEAAEPPLLSALDFTVIALYLGFGMFTRAFTDVALAFEYAGNVPLFAFAIAVVLALHLVIFASVLRAWHAKWLRRGRNIVAMSTLAGYFITQLIASI